MHAHRLCLALLLAGCWGKIVAPLARAQETGGAAGSASGSGAASSFGTPASGGSTEPMLPAFPFGPPPSAPGTGTSPASGTGTGPTNGTGTTPPAETGFGTPSSSFGTPASGFGTSGTGTGTTTGAAPVNPYSFSTPTPGTRTPGAPGASASGGAVPAAGTPGVTSEFSGGTTAAPGTTTPAFTVPAAYGQAPQSFIPGQGRLARPRFSYSTFASAGYDDNVLTTPFNAIGQEEVRQKVEVQAAQPARLIAIPRGGRGSQANGGRPFIFLIQPAQEAKFENVLVSPKVDPAEVVGSFALRAGGSAEVQFASRRTVFTMNAVLSATEYPSRPNDQFDYNGSLALVYVRRITPRMQFSATANIAYLSQPDLSRLNSPTTNVGEYFNANTKYDLTYRWTPRFSTVSSLSINSQLFIEDTASGGNFYEIVVGTEGRLLLTPRLTTLAELRYSTNLYANDPQRDSNTVFLLVGGEISLSRKLTATLRLGQQFRTFSEGGGLQTSPYLETSLNYRYSRTGFVAWNSRVGFEESPSASTTTRVLRTGINVVQAFSTRTRGTLGISAVHRVNSNDDGGDTVSENIFQIDAGLEYSLSKRSSLTANYSFTSDISSAEGTDYFRNQLFLGIQYAF